MASYEVGKYVEVVDRTGVEEDVIDGEKYRIVAVEEDVLLIAVDDMTNVVIPKTQVKAVKLDLVYVKCPITGQYLNYNEIQGYFWGDKWYDPNYKTQFTKTESKKLLKTIETEDVG